MQVQHRMGGATSRLASSRRLCVALAQHGGLAHTAARSSLPFPQPLPLPLLSLAPRAQAWGTMLFMSGLNTSAQPSHLRRVGRTTTVRVGAAAAPEAPEATSSDSADTAQATSTGFERMGLRPELLTALQAMQISSPTDVQKLAVPSLLKGGDYLLTSHTGSGKTLAYLLPLVHMLKRQEDDGFVPAPKRPRVLVVGPTKELTEQITGVAKLLSHHAKFRVVCANSSNRSKAAQEQALQKVDIVVTSPTKLLEHLKAEHMYLRDVDWLVVDEADTIFAEGWGNELGELLTPLRAKARPANVVLVSATMTKPIKRLLTAQFPNMQALQTHTTHFAIKGSQHAFQTLPNGTDKLAMLAEILARDGDRSEKALVFCNSVDSCRAVEHTLREAGTPTLCYHGDMPAGQRKENMKTFLDAAPGAAGTPVLVTTDVAARGLDFASNVHHVVNFDFPFTAVDYLHRSGRTARAGRSGYVTSIVTKRDRVLAQRIEWALEHNEPLDQLSSDPNVLPPSQREKRPSTDSRSSGRDGPRDRPPLRGSSGGSRGGGRGGGRDGGRGGGASGSGRGDRKGSWDARGSRSGGASGAGSKSSRPGFSGSGQGRGASGGAGASQRGGQGRGGSAGGPSRQSGRR